MGDSMTTRTTGTKSNGPAAWPFDRRQFLIVALPVVVFVVGQCFLFLFHDDGDFPCCDHMARDAGSEMLHRYRVAAAFLLLVVVSCSACILAVSILRKSRSRAVLGLFLLVGAFFAAVLPVYGPRALYERIGLRRIFKCTLGTHEIEVGAEYSLLNLMSGLVITANGVVAVSVTGLAFAVAALMADSGEAWEEKTRLVAGAGGVESKNTIGEDDEQRCRRLARYGTKKVRELNRILLAAAAVLTSGVLFMHSWMVWPREFSGGHADQVSVTSGVRDYMAVLFVAMLASGFIPPWLWLRTANHEVFEKYDGSGDEFWVRENREAFSKSYLAAVAGPVLIQLIVRVALSTR